ncbi:hypothetical protein [Thiolapillus sp.]
MPAKTQLLFVYNADSGAFNTLADIGHKMFSPDTYSCALCAITHGVFREKEQWRTFVASLPLECRFFHRDEFQRHYPEFEVQFPAVFLEKNNGLFPCLSADQLKSCENMLDLQRLISDCCINPREDSPL